MSHTTAISQSPTEGAQSFLTRWLPNGVVERTLFWAVLPACLFLFNLIVAFAHPSPITFPLACVSFASFIASVRYRTWGVVFSYTALAMCVLVYFREIAPEERLWQMGIVFAFATSIYTALLTTEEITALIGQLRNQAHDHLQQVHQIELTHSQVQATWNEEREALEEEIRELKDEAQLRRIERQADQERYALIETEIELLTSQKEALLSETARSREELAEKVKWVDAELTRLSEKSSDTSEQTPVDSKEFDELRRAKAQAEGLYVQLRQQFSEKSEQLSQTRKELFALQTQLEALEQKMNEESLSPVASEVRHHEEVIDKLSAEIERLESECVDLEGVISSLMRKE